MCSGVVCLGLAGLCLILTVVGMVGTFRVVAESTAATPEDLVGGIRLAMIWTFAGVPLAIIGIGLLIVGVGSRRAKE